MKKVIFSLFVLVFAVATLLTSCAGEGNGLASASFSISNNRTRTVSSGDEYVKVTKYTFTLTSTSTFSDIKESSTTADIYTFDFAKNDSEKYTISGIVPGTYSVKVDAKTSNDTIVATKTISHSFYRGVNSDVTLSLDELTGSQYVEITYNWTPSSYKYTQYFTLTITDENNDTTKVEDTYITRGDGTATYKATLPAGSYIFTARLRNKNATGQIQNGNVEVIRTTNSTDTLKETINFNDSNPGSTVINLTSNISEPIEGTLSAEKEGSTAKLSVTFSSLPDGITANDIKIQWYSEDYYLTETAAGVTSYSFDTSYAYNSYSKYTAVMICTKDGSMGSCSIVYDFLN